MYFLALPLATSYPLPALKLWMWLRGYDPRGRGRVEFSLATAARELQRGTPTIRRWLAQARACGLLRWFSTRGDSCTCYYAGLARAIAATGADGLGECELLSLGQLRSLNISISELAARELQRQSLGAKNKQVNPTGRRGCRSAKMPDLKSPGIGVQTRRALRAKLGQISKLATILGGTELRKLAERLTTQFSPESKDQRSSETSVAGALRRPRSGIIGRVGRFLLVTDFFLDFGASQAGIGGKVGRSDRTVRRHFSTKYRETSTPALSQRGGLEPIGKCQLAQRLGKAELEEFHWAEFDALHGSRDSGARRRLGRYLRIGGRLFRLGCNLYDLAPSRRWKAMRRRVRKRTNLVGADLLPNDLLLRKEPRRDLMGCKSEAELRRALERRLPDYPN